MEVALLSPQDCLKHPLRTKPNHRPNRSHQPNRRKRSPNSSPPPKKSNQLVMGQVKILKRGESVETPSSKQSSPDLNLGAAKLVEPGEIRVDKLSKGTGFYAGSAFVTSPPPSSLPLPAFIKKSVANIVDADASSNLKKMLGINLF